MCQECAYEIQHRIDQAQYCRCHVRVVLISVQLDQQAGGGGEQQQSRNRVIDQLLQGVDKGGRDERITYIDHYYFKVELT